VELVTILLHPTIIVLQVSTTHCLKPSLVYKVWAAELMVIQVNLIIHKRFTTIPRFGLLTLLEGFLPFVKMILFSVNAVL